MSAIEDLKVSARMRTDDPTVGPEDGLRRLVAVLSEHNLSSVPVVEDGKLVGVVGEADLVFQAVEDEVQPPHTLPLLGGVIFLERMDEWRERFRKAFGTTVRDLMETDPVTVSPDDTLHTAAERMVDHNVNRLPVVDSSGAVAGVISRADVVRALAEEW
jgi:CBS domain-containing protein